MKRTHMWVAGLAVIALGAFLAAQGSSRAGENKELLSAMNKLVDSLKKGDKAGAQKQAEAIAKQIEEVHEVMDLYRPRNKGGWGVGDKPKAITPDGIEQMLLKIGRDAPTANTLKKDGDALEQMAYRAAAIAEVAIIKAPKQNMGKKLVKDWVEWSKDQRDASLALAAATKARSGADIKAAAAKTNNACNTCHSTFR
jgi:cytochrome c556